MSATEAECAPTLSKMSGRKIISPYLYSGTIDKKAIEILISGIGCVNATFRLTQTLLQRPYSHAISIGIAGSFDENTAIGETVQIIEDCFADLGIDNNGEFLSLRDAALSNEAFDGDFITNPSPALSHHHEVRGITVQTASGNQKRIDELTKRYHPKVETMENAAFFYVCRKMQVHFASFRGISNKIEPRNREKWRIKEAIESVNLVVSG